MKRLFGSLFLLLMLSFSGVAIAANWVYVATDAKGNIFYLDKSKISSNKSIWPETKFWIKTLYKDGRVVKGKRAWFNLSQMGVNCGSYEITDPLQYITYDLDRIVLLDSGNRMMQLHQVAPESIEELIHTKVCGLLK